MLDLPAPPAFVDTAAARTAVWVPRPDRRESFSRLLGYPLEAVHAIGASRPGDLGPFRLRGADIDLVAKGFAGALADRQARVEALLASLPASTPISRAIDPAPLVDGAVSWWFNPFVQGHAPVGDEAEARAVGRALGQVHVALAGLEERTLIAGAARARWAKLIEPSGTWSHRGRALAAACVPLAHDILAGDDAQPLHGDVNPGNVIVAGDRAWLLDFEELPHAHGTPALDLAKTMERIAFPAKNSVPIGVALLEGWIEARRPVAPFRPGLLADALAATNLQSVALLEALEADGRRVSELEWAKFDRLIHGLAKGRDWFARVEAGYVA